MNQLAFINEESVKEYSKALLPKDARIGEHLIDMGMYWAVWFRTQHRTKKTWKFDGIKSKPIEQEKPMTFEQKMMKTIERTIISQIHKTQLVSFDYENRKDLPISVVEKVWKSLNWEVIVEKVSKELQERIASNIVQAMITEAKTDVKKVLSVQGVRQKLKMNAYPVIMKVLNENL